MGCAFSRTQDEHASEQIQLQLGEVYVFVPGLRPPKRVDFAKFLREHLSSKIIARLTSLRSKVVAAAENAGKTKISQKPGESNIYELKNSLEVYLPTLLGLTTADHPLSNSIEFAWINQEDEIKETVLSSVHYELLSVLHLLGILFLLEANSALTPKPNGDGNRAKVNEEDKRAAIEILLKAAQIFECAVKSVSPRIPEDIRMKLPADVQDGLLKSLQLQALGQGVEIQLGLAIDNVKATLAVKRRLACEEVKYWQLAYENLHQVRLRNGWGEKHVLFLKWKTAASKAAAYYYHGLVLDEGSEENTHAKAVACLQAAEGCFRESQTLCAEFSAAAPATKQPPLWGAMKYLSDKIPKEAVSKAQVNKDVYYQEKTPNKLPELPDFPLSLKADEYELPSVDGIWAEDGRSSLTQQEQLETPNKEDALA